MLIKTIGNNDILSIYILNNDPNKLCIKIENTEKNIKTVYRFKNCIIYPIDKISFVDSFRNSHGIITNAGFQTSSEALYMGKKLMVIPVKGQYEQECNAKALSDIGVITGKLDDVELFLNSDKIQFDKWIDPTEQILEIILSS